MVSLKPPIWLLQTCDLLWVKRRALPAPIRIGLFRPEALEKPTVLADALERWGMASSLGMLTGCAWIMLVGMSQARAADGHIVFSGAVVEPTCSVEDANVGGATRTAPDNVLALERRRCDRTSTSLGRSYARTVFIPGQITLTDDRLLRYFVGYVGAASPRARAKLVVRTYE